MKKTNGWFNLMKFGPGLALAAVLTGCLVPVDGGGDYGGDVFVPGPDVVVFGGGYDRGPVVRGYSHRGAVSRAVAHPAGGGHGDHRR